MKNLVLAEKPSVGKEFARILGCHQKGEGYMEGNEYVVTWTLGHLVTLKEPEDYDARYKEWNLDTLPIIPKRTGLKVLKGKGHQLQVTRQLMQRKDIKELIIATDAGREGELVARWVMDINNWRKPFKRLWISSQTDKAVREGFRNIKEGKAYDNLYESAQSRAEADWLIGLNITRALTTKYNVQLTAGRVQTPTLAMIIQREDEISRFVPVPYWTLKGNFEGFVASWQDKNGQARLNDEKRADEIAAKVRGQLAKVIETGQKGHSVPPPLLYDLTELQREANRRFGFSAQKTLQIMQSLYETHKIATYPRTDSRYITTDIVPTLKERLLSISGEPYQEMVRELLSSPLNITSRVVNDSKVSDHHAIIPTGEYARPESLNNDERRIWDLLVRRFLAVFQKPFVYDEMRIVLEVCGERFCAKGRLIQSDGWKKAEMMKETKEEGEEDDDQSFPPLREGDSRFLRSCDIKSCYTKPPSRYTEATLLSAMEHPGKFIEDEELRESFKEGGLGTPATRAEIIEKLIRTEYIERKGSTLYPTYKGRQVISLVMDELKSPSLTAKWEQRLSNIAKGKEKPDVFMKEIQEHTTKLVQIVKSSQETYQHDNLSGSSCPQCGKTMLIVEKDDTRSLICQDRKCGYRKMLVRVSEHRCLKCHRKMEIREEKKGKVFVCTRCNLREDVTGAGKDLSPREVREALRKINKEEKKKEISSFGQDLLNALKKKEET